MIMVAKQLTFPIHISDNASFDNFFAGKNACLTALLQSPRLLTEYIGLYIWGQSGVGRTHLLEALCHLCHHRGQTAAYIAMQDYHRLSPDILEGLEHFNLVCIDDIDKVVGTLTWENAFFDLYNRCLDLGVPLIVTTGSPARQLAWALPDWHSRLQGLPNFEVLSLKDEEKMAALQYRAHRRGMAMSDKVARYVLTHTVRDMRALMKALRLLEEAMQLYQRPLTVPLVKQILTAFPTLTVHANV